MQLPQTSPDGSVVVGVTALTSTAPMSHAAPCGRTTPRSSVLGGGQPAAASIAGLPARGARVSRKLGPGGLYCSEPRSGSVFGRSPATVGVQELPLSMLLPSDMMPPLQLFGVLAARMVFRTSTVPVPLLEVPPPALAPLPATVLLSRRAEPSFQRAPPTPMTGGLMSRVANHPSSTLGPWYALATLRLKAYWCKITPVSLQHG